MTSARRLAMRTVLTLAVSALALPWAAGAVDLEPTWRPPTYERMRDDMLAWKRDGSFAAPMEGQLARLWPERAPGKSDGRDLLERVAESFAVVYPEARKLVDACRADYSGPNPPDAQWLAGSDLPSVASTRKLVGV